MGHIRRRRFAVLTTVGVVATGVGAVAGAQAGLDLALAGSVVSARVDGLQAGGASITAGHGPLGSADDAVSVIRLRDVGIRSACMRLRSVDVPMLGLVTVVAEFPEGARVRADGLSIDARSVSGQMDLDGLDVANGAVPPTGNTAQSGLGLTAGSLSSGRLDVDVAGLHADRLSTTELRVHAVRGEGSC